ncbi:MULTISPECIES: dipeptide/oligopeptide/nickel ABC transporter permease/ATP-binding protein [Paenarthrobacter]|jgi:peptide/nickel transport system permease protein|uniref:dipeptide/oligopeptide/nickel ABC transporter permease/ATP-binding protein n=1 Tax=Paenarthrobacter TaxID=1742992 RepID=UPI0018781292|nr:MULTISPECIES: dipeptide/oligopeptide/nickel ABC transporter permease/ATP-binding protein [Paenarthrobacter]QOT18221.1 dipeptide/oligopeptide/nickel ABC transporter permease/ATP-binding protein [Paenarthrobacter sp. YJN-5]QQQ62948.1 dipeptide/oligopeptide/nickel ABC transporter permease/ATP-binding protein [Paenarthrobacter ureafaciens]UOD82013.1 dipeptide/oligopeptide/nickel ABC transporter permease/ATP-binding protein [Paenarthrobacter ureafaciens]WNZ05505.1 dipeptide/oligopeptide/nickel AB
MRSKLAERLSAPGIRFKALPWGSRIALLFLIVIAVAAVFAPVLAPHDPLETFIPATPPGAEHFFGTDRLGRDIFSRLLFGAQSSLMIGLGAVGLAILVGALLGSLAATSSKAVNEVIMRIMDILMAFPGIALAAVLLAAFGNSVPTIIIAIAIIYTPQLARVVRANVLAQYGEDYVRAERVIGAGRFYILVKHIVRNTAAPVLVFATVMVADAIILEASLSFLGAGVQDPAPSWGNVISYGRNLVLSGGWWATTFAGLTILLTVLSLNILAEGLTDAMVNPKLRKAPAVKDDDGSTAAVATAVDTEVATSPAQPSVVEEHELDAVRAASGDGVTDELGKSAVLTDVRTAVVNPHLLLDRELELLASIEAKRTDRLPQVPAGARNVLEVKDLSIRFPGRFGDTAIVDNVSFTVREGETMGLVGESGCGKSITSLAVMGLLPKTAHISGSIKFDGKELLDPKTGHSDPKAYVGLRGEQIAMVYQDALSSLNPSMKIKEQMEQLTKRGGRKTPTELLEMVKLDPVRTLASYPHELSGGQRQRVLIAMALSRSPKIVVADEPTTALDVTVQKQVVDLLNELREQLGFAMVFVSHDLALVASLAHRITVMYAGQVVESAQASELLQNPKHEYTRGLLGAVLSIEADAARLHQIPGTVPSPRDFATGDRFAARSLRPDADPHQKLVLTPVASANGEDTDHYWASHLKEDAK